MELISSPDTPKSHNLIDPRELKRMLDGLISFLHCQTMIDDQKGTGTHLDE